TPIGADPRGHPSCVHRAPYLHVALTISFRAKPRRNDRACGRQYLRSAICATRSKLTLCADGSRREGSPKLGLERSRRANWKHGHLSGEAKEDRSRLLAAILALLD